MEFRKGGFLSIGFQSKTVSCYQLVLVFVEDAEIVLQRVNLKDPRCHGSFTEGFGRKSSSIRVNRRRKGGSQSQMERIEESWGTIRTMGIKRSNR